MRASAYTSAITEIEREYDGQVAKMLADFIAAHMPHDPTSDDDEERARHRILTQLCDILDERGLPRPPGV